MCAFYTLPFWKERRHIAHADKWISEVKKIIDRWDSMRSSKRHFVIWDYTMHEEEGVPEFIAPVSA